jgi:hypothetical protein
MTRWLALTLTLALSLSASVASAGPLADQGSGDVSLTVAEGGVGGQYFDVNQDGALIFTTHVNPSVVIDDTIFFGILDAQTRTRLVAYDMSSAYPTSPPPAPEPAAALLAAAGAVSLAVLRRRERR